MTNRDNLIPSNIDICLIFSDNNGVGLEAAESDQQARQQVQVHSLISGISIKIHNHLNME